MAYIQLSDNMLAMLHALEGTRHAKTLAVMLGREPDAQDRKDLFKLWLNDLLRVAPGAREKHHTIKVPFHYELTDEGRAKLRRIRAGESTDQYEEGIEKVRKDNEDAKVVVVPDPGQSKRSLAAVMRDGAVDHEASRWVYSTGVLRKPRLSDLEAILEGAT